MQLLLKAAVAAHAVARAVAAHDVAAHTRSLHKGVVRAPNLAGTVYAQWLGGSRGIHRAEPRIPQNRVEMEDVATGGVYGRRPSYSPCGVRQEDDGVSATTEPIMWQEEQL